MVGARLYVGSLSAGVDEYVLAALFAKHGKISRLDFLFHKSGPLKGQPRGYSFVEYSTREEAESAIRNLNGKVVRGKAITVSYASEQAEYETSKGPSALTGRGQLRQRPHASDSSSAKPTPISLLKSRGVGGSSASTDRKIAALEAKLAAIKRAKEPPPPSEPSTSTSTVRVDAKAAGLPARPWFDAPPPEQTKQM